MEFERKFSDSLNVEKDKSVNAQFAAHKNAI